MTLLEFIKKYTGQEVDFDGWYGTQCMDLMHQYVYDVLGIKNKTVLAAPSAKEVYLNFKWGDLFDKIDNTPNGIPREGDIIFWSTGQWGHVAIFIEGTVNSFKSFDANWPTGTLPHIQGHYYTNVLGWLRVKDNDDSDEDVHRDCVTINDYIDMKAQRDRKDEKYEDMKDQKTEMEESKNSIIEQQEQLVKELQNNNAKLIIERDGLKEDVNSLEEGKDSLESRIGALELEAVEGLKNQLKLEEDLAKEKKKSKGGLEGYNIWELLREVFTRWKK